MSSVLQAMAGVLNACEPLPGLLTGGQPSADHFEALSAAGLATVLDCRHPSEPRGLQEEQVLQGLGISYFNVPVVPGGLTDEVLEKILTVLRGNSGEPLLFHCQSGNRVGAALIPHFMLDHGMDQSTAIQLAMSVGLRSPDMLQWGLSFAQRRNESP